MNAPLRVGDRVRVNTPENTRLHDAEGTVEALERWGAVLALPAAAAGRFRALWSEMERSTPAHRSDAHASGAGQQPAPAPTVAAERKTAVGFFCDTCGGANMTRTGTCLTCQDCGTSSGGCG